ncbi:MAG: alkaline phosphatase family protein [Filimonas sp.]|nr:alkaline phosphatase family protein [Filimonas sp.]
MIRKKLFAALTGTFLLSNSFAQQVQHVIIVTIDGFRPDFYLQSSWQTPNLKRLMKQGVYAMGVNSVLPSVTYPSHTTIVTGVQPAEHGVYYNGRYDATGNKSNEIYWNDTSIHVPTLWSTLHQQGKKVASLIWPVSADAPVDYNIPDIGNMGEDVRNTFSKPAGFIDEVKKNVFNDTAAIDWGRDPNVARIAAYIIAKDKPTLMTIHLLSVDHAEHTQGRSGPMVEECIASADSAVGIIQEALVKNGIADNTLLIVTGDHGFKNVTTTVKPNVWLAKAGLQNNIKKGDWKARFFSSGGADFLYIKDRNDAATTKQVNDLLKALPDSVTKYFEIIDRKQLDAIGGNPEVAFVLSGKNGAAFSNTATGEAIEAGKGGTHGYFPNSKEIQTGFIAYGAGVKNNGTVINEMNLRDIAPLVAHVLGISFPSAKGKIPASILAK